MRPMQRLFLFVWSACALSAQSGAYHWVQLSIRGSGAALDVRNGGGTLGLNGNRATFTGTAVGAAFASVGTFENGRLSNALIAGQLLEIRTNADASVLIGSSATPDSRGETFDLFVAVRQGTTPVPASAFSAAYFAVNGGRAQGMVSAMLDFRVSATSWDQTRITGHVAARDDVNREEQIRGVSYSIGAGGAGVVRFPEGSDYLSGDRRIMVSADGAWILGYSPGTGTPDILVAHGRPPGRSVAELNGLYWMSEITAEEPFAFDPALVRFSASAGSFRGDGTARAEISGQVVRQKASGTSNTWLTTANSYYSDSTTGRAALVPALTSDRSRNNFHFSPQGLIGAQVGTPGEVTLEHGILVGLKAPNTTGDGAVRLSQLGAFNGATFAIGPVSALGYLTLFGDNLAPSAAVAAGYPFPTELAGTRVLVNGQLAPLHSVSPSQINFQFPVVPNATATLQVSATAGVSTMLTVPVSESSPGVFRGAVLHANSLPVTSSSPARPGEVLVVYATGLGAVNPRVQPGEAAPVAPLSHTTDPNLRVYISGEPAVVEFSGLAPGYAGLYQLNIRVPDNVAASAAAPVAISLAGAFTDLAEIPIAAF